MRAEIPDGAEPAITAQWRQRLVSEANKRGSWRKHEERRKTQRADARTQVHAAAGRRRPKLPIVIVATRISPKAFDSDDNLPMSFKHVRDGVHDWLKVDDGSDDVRWLYEWEQGKPHTVRIEIYQRAVVRTTIEEVA